MPRLAVPSDDAPDKPGPPQPLEFPSTLWSEVLGAAGSDEKRFEEAVGKLLERYHSVIAAYCRMKCKDPGVSLEKLREEGFEPSEATEADVERQLDLAVAAAVHERSIAALRASARDETKLKRFQCLEPFILTEPDYQKAGEVLGLKSGVLRQAVFRLRNDYFVAFRSKVSQMVANRPDLDQEVRYLLSLVPYLKPSPQ